MQQTIQISTPAHHGLWDITRQVETVDTESGVKTGRVNPYPLGAIRAIRIEFNKTRNHLTHSPGS